MALSSHETPHMIMQDCQRQKSQHGIPKDAGSSNEYRGVYLAIVDICISATVTVNKCENIFKYVFVLVWSHMPEPGKFSFLFLISSMPSFEDVVLFSTTFKHERTGDHVEEVGVSIKYSYHRYIDGNSILFRLSLKPRS